jgi:hypothetical protein
MTTICPHGKATEDYGKKFPCPLCEPRKLLSPSRGASTQPPDLLRRSFERRGCTATRTAQPRLLGRLND